MKNEVYELRRQIRATRADGQRGPFPRELRHRLQAYLRRRWDQGESLRDLAAELGLSDHTVQYWRSRWRQPTQQGALKVVEVISEEPSGLTLHGPHGTRVENLTLSEVTDLWRRLS